MSKIAFITTYFTGHWFRDKKVHAINNGFSFVDHLFENHQHFFINLSSVEEAQKDVDCLKEELKKFDIIYLSIADTTRIYFGIICQLIDRRFVVGGPAIKYIDVSKIENITGAKFIKETFEHYLGIPLQKKFTNYWSKVLGENKTYQFIITHSNSCYNNCTFCNVDVGERVNRDFEDILNQAILNNDRKYIFLSKPSVTIEDFKIIKKMHKKIVDSNTSLFFYVRSDDAIYDFVNKNFDDLSNLEFFNGLEYFSNSCLKRINKNTTLEKAYRLAEMVLSKNGKIMFSYIESSPIFSDEELLDSIKNYKKFKELFMNHEKIFFRRGRYLFFYNMNNFYPMYKNFYNYKLFNMIDNNIVAVAMPNTENDRINNEIFSKYMDELYRLNSEKLLEYHKRGGI